MEFSTSEIVVEQQSNLYVIRGKYQGSHNYRAELCKIDDECSEFVFGTLSNVDDYYVCVLRCKLYTCTRRKIAFIMDLRGFANNLYDPIEIYRLNAIENYWRLSQENMDLFDLSLRRMLDGWDIRKYDDDGMFVHELSANIFNNVLFYPRDLDKFIPGDIISKIHDLNRPGTINVQALKWHYIEDEMMDLWSKCDETQCDKGNIAVWFGLDKDYAVFEK